MGYQGNGRDEVRNGWNREETVARLVPSSLTLVGSCLPSFGCVSLTHPSPHLRLVSASGDERREEAERREQEVRDDEGRLLGPSISACGHRYHLSTLVSSSVPLLLTSPKAPRDEGTRWEGDKGTDEASNRRTEECNEPSHMTEERSEAFLSSLGTQSRKWAEGGTTRDRK